MKAAEARRGNVIERDGRLYQVREVERSAPTARGGNVTFRFVLYSIPGGQKLDISLRADDDLREAELVRRVVDFSYREGATLVFMDHEDYTQYPLDADLVGTDAGYVNDGIEGCYIQLHDGRPVALQLPASVVLEVVDTAPELKGASATRRTKPARLATGLTIQVPEYVTTGEKIRVNTVTGEFAGRA